MMAAVCDFSVCCETRVGCFWVPVVGPEAPEVQGRMAVWPAGGAGTWKETAARTLPLLHNLYQESTAHCP